MPSSSLFLRSSTTLVSALLLLSSSAFADTSTYYALDTEYSGSNFFDGFNFFADADPTHGFVTYVDEGTARDNNLISSNGGSVQMRVDSQNPYNGNVAYSGINGVGRPSVRIESVKSWTHGLFVADIKHMPTTTDGSGCGVWPAFWTLGSGTWPYNGEVDIIEGANNQNTVLTAAHVAGTCVISQSPFEMTGTSNGVNCQYDVNTGANAQGCGAFDTHSNSYGPGFNSNRGGVYAMEWTSDAIKIWFFPRNSIPSDIASGTPDPSGWGSPASIFNGPGCDIDANFEDHRIIFDTTFCGDWADATWSSGGCAARTGVNLSIPTRHHDNFNFYHNFYHNLDLDNYNYNYDYDYNHTGHHGIDTIIDTVIIIDLDNHNHAGHLNEPRVHPVKQHIGTHNRSTSVPTTGGPVIDTTSSTVTTTPYVPTTTPSSSTSLPETSTTSQSVTGGPFFPSSSSTSTSSSSSTHYGGGPATTSEPFTATTTTWADWSGPSSSPVSLSTPGSSSSSTFQWQDWTTSSTKPVDPATTTSATTWGDWSDSDSIVTVTITSYTTKTTTITTTHCGCTETPVPTACMTTVTFTPSAGWPFSKPIVATVPCAAPAGNTSPPVVPTSTAPAPGPSGSWGWGSGSGSSSSGSGKPVSPVSAASTGTDTGSAWVSPSVTLATTLTVAPVQSSAPAWVAAASNSATPVTPVTPVAPASTSPWVAQYTGAAGRTTLNGLAMLSAIAVALLGVFAL
ncbi:hypothetical protein AYO20_08197 [Fonsecaea nubica]|uniref:GH16 domain-containing protein n=1 Tax=Fonsecaea nubica TaxID=856822 RepID=A0A178CQU3_9EURO|nr:hypothetical protein AYO20_08197 [Fonsecaea nubica]OAL31654.1 hypothetical protein AYO20_08197 [Fonsecaea nubica]